MSEFRDYILPATACYSDIAYTQVISAKTYLPAEVTEALTLKLPRESSTQEYRPSVHSELSKTYENRRHILSCSVPKIIRDVQSLKVNATDTCHDKQGNKLQQQVAYLSNSQGKTVYRDKEECWQPRKINA